MNNIQLAATERTPFVHFDFDERHLVIKGESYPEDAAAFFGPLHLALRGFLAGEREGGLVMDLEMSYFNSSSAKALMNLFQMLETAAAGGYRVVINWHFHEDDDTIQEFGEDFAEDFSAAKFNLCPIA